MIRKFHFYLVFIGINALSNHCLELIPLLDGFDENAEELYTYYCSAVPSWMLYLTTSSVGSPADWMG